MQTVIIIIVFVILGLESVITFIFIFKKEKAQIHKNKTEETVIILKEGKIYVFKGTDTLPKKYRDHADKTPTAKSSHSKK